MPIMSLEAIDPARICTQSIAYERIILRVGSNTTKVSVQYQSAIWLIYMHVVRHTLSGYMREAICRLLNSRLFSLALIPSKRQLETNTLWHEIRKQHFYERNKSQIWCLPKHNGYNMTYMIFSVMFTMLRYFHENTQRDASLIDHLLNGYYGAEILNTIIQNAHHAISS